MEERQSDIPREVAHLTYRQLGWSKPGNDSQSEKERKKERVRRQLPMTRGFVTQRRLVRLIMQIQLC